LLNPKPWDDVQILPPDVIPALDALREKVSSTYSSERSSIYLEAIQHLHKTFEAYEMNLKHLPIAFYWLVVLEHNYIDLLKQRDPMALVIFAHFGAVCQAASTLWWAKNWDSLILDAAYQELDDEWRPLISWPIQKIRARTRDMADQKSDEGDGKQIEAHTGQD
jgi:hypothetical protein